MPKIHSMVPDASPTVSTRRLPMRDARAVQVKSEERLTISIPSATTSPSPSFGWNHPDELPFLDASAFSQDSLIKHIITHAISVPGRPASRMEQWASIKHADGRTTVIPAAYRIPLLFTTQFMWSSLQLVLGVEDDALRMKEWEQFRGSILHVSRICDAFLSAARKAGESGNAWGGNSRKWRCATLDRVLTRYRMRWMLSTPKELKEFHEIHGDVPYQRDVVKCHWKGIAVQGFNGFKVSEERIINGVSVQDFVGDLRRLDGDRGWVWTQSAFTNSGTSTSAVDIFKQWREKNEWPISIDGANIDVDVQVSRDAPDGESSPLTPITVDAPQLQAPPLVVVQIPEAPSEHSEKDSSPSPISPLTDRSTSSHPTPMDSLRSRLYNASSNSKRNKRRRPASDSDLSNPPPPPKVLRSTPAALRAPPPPSAAISLPSRGPKASNVSTSKPAPVPRTSSSQSHAASFPVPVFFPPPPTSSSSAATSHSRSPSQHVHPYGPQPEAPDAAQNRTFATLLGLIDAYSPTVQMDHRLRTLEEDLAVLWREVDGEVDRDDGDLEDGDDRDESELPLKRGTGILRPVMDGISTPAKFSRKSSSTHGMVG